MKRYVHIFTKGDSTKNLLCSDSEYINVINRVWLVAKATDSQVLAVSVMTNHIHLVVYTSSVRSFMYHLSNACERYFRGILPGLKPPKLLRFGLSKITDPVSDFGADLKDTIMYVCRNPKLHGFSNEALAYRWSSAGLPFRLFPCPRDYSFIDVPPTLAKAFLPYPHILPRGWHMSSDGSIVPSVEVYPVSLIETHFDTPSSYIRSLGTRTVREGMALSNETEMARYVRVRPSVAIPVSDQDVRDYVIKNFSSPFGTVARSQTLRAMKSVRKSYPHCSRKVLSRVFDVPLFYIPLNI